MKQNARGFVHLLVPLILALIVLAGIGYYAYKNGQIKLIPQGNLSPTPATDETANWIEYINTKHSYLVKYPENWIYKELNQDYVYFNPLGVSDNDQSVSITVTNNKSTINPVIADFKTVRNITVSGQEIEIKKYKSGTSVFRYIAKVKNGDNTFTFGFSIYTYKKYEPYFDQILSTFKFLESSSTDKNNR